MSIDTMSDARLALHTLMLCLRSIALALGAMLSLPFIVAMNPMVILDVMLILDDQKRCLEAALSERQTRRIARELQRRVASRYRCLVREDNKCR